MALFCKQVILVLFLPSLQQNLLSISQLTAETHFDFKFTNYGFSTSHRFSRRVVAQGNKLGNAYVLKFSIQLAFFSNRQTSTTYHTWHSRHGQCSSQILKFLQAEKMLSVNGSSRTLNICEACQLVKSKRLPFTDSVNHSLQPFDRIHCDLWGPVPINSWNGFRYYDSFVDDCSRFVWYYPLKNKSDFFSIYLSFEHMIFTEFDNKIKSSISDGGG